MLRAAAYCRVSTDNDDQAHSYESQKRYFAEYINREPEMELTEIYADEGISGTSTKKRAAFNRMISDAQLGKFDVILTKEVSRFARNTVDTLQFTRQLKALGIGVRFMNDGINTMEPDAELRLSIMGSLAQEESRKTSARVKWGQTRRMEQGVVFGRSMLGYDVENGELTVEPEGAEIVKLIFHKYVNERKGTSVIARELREDGYKSYRGEINWSNTSILRILRNEKYCGDLLQKKTYTPDYLTHEKKYNRGAEEKVFIENHHEPIISKELWMEAQREIARRNRDGKLGECHGNRYLMSGKIKCSCCGKSFVANKKKRKDGSSYRVWRCSTATRDGYKHEDQWGNIVGCDIGYQIRDELCREALMKSILSLKMNKEKVMKEVAEIVTNVIQMTENREYHSTESLKKTLHETEEKKKRVLDAFFSGDISKSDLAMMNQEYEKKIKELMEQIDLAKKRSNLDYDVNTIEADVRKHINDIVTCRAENDLFYGSLLDHIAVYPEKRLVVHLKLLPTEWWYMIDGLSEVTRKMKSSETVHEHDIPTSVSTPATSRYGME